MQFSIIIPFYNEASTLANTLQHLQENFTTVPDNDVEIILCNGDSTDNSAELAGKFPVIMVDSTRGRARQMNAGAQQAQGKWLVFLHADSQLPNDWAQLIAMQDRAWGRFDVRLSGPSRIFRVIEFMMNFRSCKTAVATGDQALFFRQSFFNQLGGFPEIALMEDIAISKLARERKPPACIRQPVITSSRRWEQKGILRTILQMWFLRLAYWLGVKPSTLHRWYYAQG